ncbi:MAG TPA: VOC family protein [Acetobacteraceae bacterium]|nr:VOC family protein [Acetobacteraceae bacterium]
MMKIDHISLPVGDLARSRDWYVSTLGLQVEFEVPERRTVALQDTDGFAIFLVQSAAPIVADNNALWFQVDDVDVTFAAWSAHGTAFAHGPRKSFWGYGVELTDPDGRPVRLWDQRSMREK